MKILGIDPGLRHTGWGIIFSQDGRLSHIAQGTISPDVKLDMSMRLFTIQRGLMAVCEQYLPDQVAIEEIFVNKNPASTLKLGMARGAAFTVPAHYQIPLEEYSANLVKKTLVGAGHAKKEQIQMMVKTLLPKVELNSADEADALAVAICHAQHFGTNKIIKEAMVR